MSFDSIGGYFPNHLNIDNYETKYEILNILIQNKNFVSNKKGYSEPLINCLLDKNGNIRAITEEISQEIEKILDYHFLMMELKF